MADKRNVGRRQALLQQGTLYPHSDAVTNPLFRPGEFFDPQDIVQVKYEMLRLVEVDKAPVAHAAAAFGFSRPSFYQAQAGFSKSGMVGLIPQKKGPRRAHKFSPEILEFVASLQVEQPSLHPPDLAQRIREEFGVAVHPRSVERALARSKKKPL